MAEAIREKIPWDRVLDWIILILELLSSMFQ